MGFSGALAAYIGFGLPAFILMLMFSILYTKYHSIPVIVSLFNGLQVVVTAIVANATYTFGRSTFQGYKEILVAAVAFVLFQAGVSPFAVIVAAAATGLVSMRGAELTAPSPEKYSLVQADCGTGSYRMRRTGRPLPLRPTGIQSCGVDDADRPFRLWRWFWIAASDAT